MLKKEAKDFQNFVINSTPTSYKIQIEPFVFIKFKEQKLKEKEENLHNLQSKLKQL